VTHPTVDPTGKSTTWRDSYLADMALQNNTGLGRWMGMRTGYRNSEVSIR